MLATSPRLPRITRRVPARVRNLLRYASVSAISTAVGLSTLALLVGAGNWSPTWANVVATALGTIPSFELNRRWVWRRQGRSSLRREVLPFVTLCLLELFASTEAVRATAAWTARAGWTGGPRTAADLVANVIAYGSLWIVQYVVLDKVLFARRRGDGAGPPPAAAGRQSREGKETPELQGTLCPPSGVVEEPASVWVR